MSKQTPDKDPTWPPAPNYPADAFAGAARYYAQYRVPYPQEMIDDLRMRAGITGRGRLLDLGCGPGRVALPLSPYFSEVWAIDREPEMIEVGREEAGRLGTTNLRWMVGRAEDLMAPPGSFELITAGEAWYRGKGFTHDPASLDEYFDLLMKAGRLAPNSPEVVARARLYAYHFFFRRMIALPGLGFQRDRTVVRSLKDLLPGRDSHLDTICDGILSGTPFVDNV